MTPARLEPSKVLAQGELAAGEGPLNELSAVRWVALERDPTRGKGWLVVYDYAYQTWWYVQNYGKRLRGQEGKAKACKLCPQLNAEEFVL